MTWLRQEDGQVVIDVFRKSDKKYDRWAVSNCGVPDSTGGSQCAPSGGGCVSSCLDLLDIGYSTDVLHIGRQPNLVRCSGLRHLQSCVRRM
jgi:hypothetical protein